MIAVFSLVFFITSWALSESGNEKLAFKFLILTYALFACEFMLYPFYKISKNASNDATYNNGQHHRNNEMEMNIYTDHTGRII